MRARSLALSVTALVLLLTGCSPREDAETPTPATSATSAATAWSAKGAVGMTPIIAGSHVLAVRDDQEHPTLLAYDKATGTLAWEAPLVQPVATTHSPSAPPENHGESDHEVHALQIVANVETNTVYAAWPTPNTGAWTVRASTIDTGKTLWTRSDTPGIALHATPSGVVLGTGFAASDIEVAEPTGTALLAQQTGRTLWTSDAAAPLGVSGNSILTSTSTDPFTLTALDPATAKVRWTHTDVTERAVVAEAASEQHALVTLRDRNGVPRLARILDTTTGEKVGSDLPLPADADVTTRIDRDTNIALLGDGTTLRGVDLATGTTRWSRPSGPDPVTVAGSGLAWVSAESMVLNSLTGKPVSGITQDAVMVAADGLALATDENLHAFTLPRPSK